MIKNYFTFKKTSLICTLFLLWGTLPLLSQIIQTYTSTGALQSFTVPSCVATITMETWGAQGGSGYAGNQNFGGYAKGVFSVSANDVLNIYVGSQPTNTLGGFNGGGTGDLSGYGGGGASDVRLNGIALSNRIIIAGGGGGASYWSGEEVVGGAGGGLTGGDGSRTNYATNPGGQGATQTGSGYGTCGSFNNTSVSGGLGYGGVAGGLNCLCDGYGGGGGYYGGAASGNCRGGGGGSGYLLPAATGTLFATGTNTANGRVVLSYFTNGSGVLASSTSTLLCTGSSATLSASNVVSYTWSPGGSNSTSLAVSPTANTSYTIQGTNSIGCISTKVINITVSGSLPSLSVSTTSASVCPSTTVALTASGALTYTWSNNVPNATSFTPAVTTIYTVSGTNGCGTTMASIGVTVTPLPVTATASSTLICSGSTATLTAGGATNYTWTPGNSNAVGFIVSPFTATTYSVIGVTGICSGSTTIFINTNAVPTLTASTSNSTICNGGSTSLNVTGNAVSYTWSPGNQTGTSISVTPTTTTLYSVTGINAANCTSGTNQVIIVTPNPTVNVSLSNPIVCPGGSSTLTASGADSYTWTNTSGTSLVVNPTSNSVYNVIGSYTVTGCSGTGTAAVSVLNPAVSVSGNTAVCSGSVVSVSANGADTYTWSTGGSGPAITITPTLTTVYTVTGSVTDQNTFISCDASNSVQVAVNANPVITATADRTVICLNNSAILTADGAGANGTYTWTGGSGAVHSATNQVSPIASQAYNVTGVDGNGCKGSAALSIQVAPCTGIKNFSASANLVIYPNPSNGEFTITSDQNITLHITNELGQQVRTITFDNASREAKVSSLANGVYFITGKNENGSVKEKIIVEK